MQQKDDQNFGEILIQGLKEAIAYERGELKDVRVHRREIRRTDVPGDDHPAATDGLRPSD